MLKDETKHLSPKATGNISLLYISQRAKNIVLAPNLMKVNNNIYDDV